MSIRKVFFKMLKAILCVLHLRRHEYMKKVHGELVTDLELAIAALENFPIEVKDDGSRWVYDLICKNCGAIKGFRGAK